MKVQNLMIGNVATVEGGDNLDRAARLMHERECGCVVVMAKLSKVVGVLTDRDVCMAALRSERALFEIRVDDAMSGEVLTCRAGDSIEEAQQSMARHQVRRLPVVDGKECLVGILSLDDIAREAWGEAELFSAPVSAKLVGTTLGQICRPHLAGGGDR